MIISVILYLGAILTVVAMVVFLRSLASAPLGAEDETGFHYLKESRAARSRYFSAKSLVNRPACNDESFKTHIPAA